jgi:hypothetical protein
VHGQKLPVVDEAVLPHKAHKRYERRLEPNTKKMRQTRPTRAHTTLQHNRERSTLTRLTCKSFISPMSSKKETWWW